MDATSATTQKPGPIFSEADYDRAIAILDLILQDNDWFPGENYLRGVCDALCKRGITLALARALIRRLIEAGIFRHNVRIIPAGTSWENGYLVDRCEPERIEHLITTYEQWYGYLAEHKSRAHTNSNGGQLASSPGAQAGNGDRRMPLGDQGTQAKTPHPDGPEPPCWFWWNGERSRIGKGRSRRPWELLRYMWTRDSATFQELRGPECVWSTEIEDSTISSTVNRINAFLPVGMPRRLAIHNYCVVWRESQ
jgi:hypothetical protein